MKTIADYSDITGIATIRAGYENVSTYSREELQNLLKRLENHETVRICFIPHKDGGNVLMLKAHDVEVSTWLCIAPILHKSSGPVQTVLSGDDDE